MDEYMMFKQGIRGFDKDEVLAFIHKQEAETNRQITALERDIRKRDKIISELKSRLVLKDEQVERMEQDIKSKYQKYIDNYEAIGALVYESKVKGDKIVADAQSEADRIVSEAERDAKKRISEVQSVVDAKLNDGKKKHLAVQDEMNEIVDLFNQMQKKFMQSYKEIHEIIQSMPVSLDEIALAAQDPDDEYDEADEEILDDDIGEVGDDVDDYDDLDDAELEALLNFEIGDLDDLDDPGLQEAAEFVKEQMKLNKE